MITDEAPGLTLPEELLLLAHDPADGTRLCPIRDLRHGLAGAVLAELELCGLVVELSLIHIETGGATPPCG